MDKPKQMIVVRRDLKMRKGKIAAQAGHACVTAVLAALEREGRLSQVHAETAASPCCRPDSLPRRSANGSRGAWPRYACM